MTKLYKLTLAISAIMIAFSTIHAQQDDYKWEGFGGYAYMNLNRGLDKTATGAEIPNYPSNRVNAHGFNGSLTYNFHRYVGATFDFTAHTHGSDFTSPLQISAPPAPPIPAATIKESQSVYQYLFGIQVKDNKKDSQVLKPYFHFLGGFAHETLTLDETTPTSAQLFHANSTDFAMKFGGGLDLRIHKNVDVRLIGFDWNPIYRSDLGAVGRITSVPAALQNNYMFSFGVVFH